MTSEGAEIGRRSWADACASFRWSDGLAALGWLERGDVDLAGTIVDRHAASGRPALRWFGGLPAGDGRDPAGDRGETVVSAVDAPESPASAASRELAFAELARESNRFANLLVSLGVRKGDRVAGFLPRVPETVVAMVGTWKAGAVYVPIFTGFGPDAIAYRIESSGARVLCTHHAYRDRVPAFALPTAILTIANAAVGGVRRSTRGSLDSAPQELAAGRGRTGDIDFKAALASQSQDFENVRSRRDEPAVLLYTSGSTGQPKGVMIAANFLLAVHPYTVFALDLRDDDVFWPTGDPGWGYGLVCYMAALARGVAVVSHEAAPAPTFTLARLGELGVTNLATTPTLLRGIMALGADVVKRYAVRLRAVSSCGEPLNAEVVSFFRAQWDVTVMDQYGSSEFGLPIGNANALDMAVKPGSMGLPLPGCRMAIVDDEGRELPSDLVGQIGMRPDDDGYYALGYWQDAERTKDLFRGGWMTIGDLGRRDADGYFWFEGRADDVIKSAGYRIGPFEVESALLGHPDVAEAAVIGKPDALRGHIVKAYVVLKPGAVATTALGTEIAEVVRSRLGRHQVPREIEFVERLPKTETGKIQRFVLRERAAMSG